jgi:hypothetical protein
MSLTAWVLFLPLAAPVLAPDKEADAKQFKADMAAFKDFLKAEKLDGRWQNDATPLNTEEVRKAYRGRIYFTYQAPPLPPGAFLPELIERHRRAMEEYKKHSLRITVLIDGDKVKAMRKHEDFNTGLMAVTTDDEARIAAAAILSMLDADHVAPGRVDAKDVKVESSGKGWVCSYSKPMSVDGKVTFNADGKCTAVEKRPNFIMPLPPAARPGGGIPRPLPPEKP